MNLFDKLCKFLVSNMSLLVLAVGAFAIWEPSAMSWAGAYIPTLLGIIMFGMGMTLSIDDFKNVLKQPKAVALGVFAQFLIMPLVALALVKIFALPPEIGIGVILLGTCPGGTASNVISYLAKGDVALSVSMSTVSTLLAPVVTPLLTWVLADAVIDISVLAMMKSIAQMVLLPVILGVAVHHYLNDLCQRVMKYMPVLSTFTILVTVGAVVSLSASKILSVGALLAAVVVLHNGLGLLLGYWLAKLAGQDKIKARTISIEVGMQNSGMAAALCVTYFDPVSAIPGAIFSVWHNVSGAMLANYFARKEEAAETKPSLA